MPVNRRSLGVTDAYRRRMLEIRRKGEQMVRQTWGDVDPEDLAGTFKVKPLANGVGTLQRTGVMLSQAYVQAFIKSEIGKDVLIPTPQGFSGDSFDDVKLRFALWRPVVLVRQLLEQGVDMPEAMRRGRDLLLRSVSLATDGAIRDSLTKLYDRQPEIVGWKRAVKGTCDICMGAADGSTLPPGTPLDIHPNCECVSEAVVKPQASQAQMQSAAEAYVRGSTTLNRKLWAGEDLQGTAAQQAQALDAAIEASPLSEGTVLWRGMPLDMADVNVGDEMFSRGFMSTTPSQDRAAFYAEGLYGDAEPTLLRVVGNKAADMEKLVPQDARKTLDLEPEKVFARNSKMKVVKISHEQFDSPLYGVNKRIRVVDVRISG